jgi:hypothetical protein
MTTNKIYNDYSESKDIINPFDVVLAWWGEDYINEKQELESIGGPFYSVRFFHDFDPNELDCKHMILITWDKIQKDLISINTIGSIIYK